MRCVYSFKIPPHKIRISYTGKKSNFTVGKSRRHQLNQVIKGNTTSHSMRKTSGPPDRMQWKEHNLAAVAFLPKMHDLNNAREHQTSLNGDICYRIICFEISKCHGDKNQIMLWRPGRHDS